MDFGIDAGYVCIFYYSKSAMYIIKDLVQHKRTMHIDIRHYFLRNNVENDLVSLIFCFTEDQIIDIFTKV